MNSYATISEADDYFGSHIAGTQWLSIDDSLKEAALKQATLHIDTLQYTGQKTDPIAINEFPRNGQLQIPIKVKYACMEEAFAILTDTDAQRRKLIDQGVTSFSLGDLSENYDIKQQSIIISSIAKQLLKAYQGGGYNAV